MKTKNILPFLLVIFCAIAFGHAQERRVYDKEKHEKIKALKVAYITEKLSLTVEEAEKFWPIYNAFSDTSNELRNHELRGIKEQLKGVNLESLSEKDAQQLLDKMNAIEVQMHQERLSLMKNLQKVIPAKKILLLKKVEDDFNRDLIYRLRQGKRNHKP